MLLHNGHHIRYLINYLQRGWWCTHYRNCNMYICMKKMVLYYIWKFHVVQ